MSLTCKQKNLVSTFSAISKMCTWSHISGFSCNSSNTWCAAVLYITSKIKTNNVIKLECMVKQKIIQLVQVNLVIQWMELKRISSRRSNNDQNWAITVFINGIIKLIWLVLSQINQLKNIWFQFIPSSHRLIPLN